MKTQHQVKAPAGLLQMQNEVTDVTWLSQKYYIKGPVWHQGHFFKQCGLLLSSTKLDYIHVERA